MLYKLVTGGHTTGPAFTDRIETDLIRFRRVNARQPYLGGVDLNRVAVDYAGHASDVGCHGGGGGDQQGEDKPKLHVAVRLIDGPSLFAFVRIAVGGRRK
jgi:hypothetical protein